MESSNNESPNNSPQSGLSSAEYRAKLLTKLNCLIAVLQVAIAKISRSMDLPGANEDRLVKIRSNLENTMSICKRAKGTLEKGLNESMSRQTTTRERSRDHSGPDRMSYRDYVELSSIDEYRKFKTLPPIGTDDLESLDMDDLMRKLSED